MSTQQKQVKTTIEFDADLFYLAKARALEKRTSFKNYINTLVSQDIGVPKISKKASMRYENLAKEIEKKMGVFQVNDADDLMDQLDK